MLKNKKILYIVHNYNSFQKDPIEEVSNLFEKVYVLVRYKPVSSIAKLLPIKWLAKFEDSYVVDLKNLPKNVHVIKTPVWYLPFGFLYQIAAKSHFKAVDRAIKRYDIKFDLIHSHFAWTSGYVGMKLKEKYVKPFVLTAHGYDIYDLPFQNNSWKNKIQEVLNSADEIITVSEYAKAFFKKLDIKKEPRVLQNGFSENLFNKVNKDVARNKLGLPKKKKIILSIGNLEKVKGYELLMHSLKAVHDKKQDFLFIHIGEGSQRKKIENFVKALNLREKVSLIGKKPHSELKYWYCSCDIFVSASLFETGPVVMFESLACGRPFIGTKVGSSLQVINSEDYGKLTEPKNIEEFAANILWALEKDWDEEKILKHSKKYTWRKAIKETINLYEKIV